VNDEADQVKTRRLFLVELLLCVDL
jgi:hypothetical protein